MFGACEAVAGFLDTLTNWYIRRSRDRFWAGEQDAVDALHTALATLGQVAAPLLPLVTEHIYTDLAGDSDAAVSVHLTDWPESGQFPYDADLHSGMGSRTPRCASGALAPRGGRAARAPAAARRSIASPAAELMRPPRDILRDELNVKQVELTTEVDRFGSKQLILHPKTLGPRLGGRTQDVIRAHKAGDWTVDDVGVVTVGGIVLLPEEFDFRVAFSAGEGAIGTLKGAGGLVVLDTEVTPELELEGSARDLIRQIQQARREAGLDVSDRIALDLTAAPDVVAAFEAHRQLVEGETLATSSLAVVDPEAAPGTAVVSVSRA